MARHDESYEQAITKLLTDSLEQGVPEDTDVWASVQQRLSQRTASAHSPAEPKEQRGWHPIPSLLTRPAAPGVLGKKRSYLSFATTAVGFSLLALITVMVISRFAQQKGDFPLPLAPTTLSTTLFTVPVDKASVHWYADTWPGTAAST